MNPEAFGQAQARIAEAIKALKQTRDAHEEYLSGHETRTRQLLIDPLLEALGWDVRNPAQVHLEYKGSLGKPDYALLSHGKVVVLIEAKRLGESLARNHSGQVIKYVRDPALTSLKYVVWTNSDHWQIWLMKENREESFLLSNTQEYECALKAMPLLRSALEAEERGAASPVPAQTRPSASHDVSVPPTPEPAQNGDRVPITLLNIEKGQKPPPNAEIEFPDSSTKPIKHWRDLWVGVAQYLVETNRISAEDCPVHEEGVKTYLVHTKSTHGTGRPFDTPKEIGELWLETHYGSTSKMHKNAWWLLENFNIDPSTVLVTNPS